MNFKSFFAEDLDVRYLKLKDACEICSGISFRTSFYRDSGFPVVKVRNIQDGKITTEDLNYCDPRNHPDALVIKYGDVVMGKDGSLAGKVGINLTDREFFFDSHVFKFVPNEKILISRYLYHFLLSCPTEIKRLVIEGTIPGIRKSEIGGLMIPIPSLEVQRKIAETLDKFREIEREINLRTKQYEYYRNYLINGGSQESSF